MENKNNYPKQQIWTRLSKDKLNKEYFYNENTSFMCDYKDVFPNNEVIVELVGEMLEYCEKRLNIKVANQERSIAVREICDKNKKVKGYEISLNDNTKNHDLYPNIKFFVNAFVVNFGEKYNKNNNYLTKKLHQLQQNKNPYYYIYLTNYILACVYPKISNGKDIDFNKVLSGYGLKYNNRFYNVKGIRLENILYDKKYFYGEKKNNEIEK